MPIIDRSTQPGPRPSRRPIPQYHPQSTGDYAFSLMEHSIDAYQFTVKGSPALTETLFRELLRRSDISFLIIEYHAEHAEPTEGVLEGGIYCSPCFEEDEVTEALTPDLANMILNPYIGFGIASNRRGFECFCSGDGVVSIFTDRHLVLTDLLSRCGFHFNPELQVPEDEAFFPSRQLQEQATELSSKFIDRLDMYPIDDPVVYFFSQAEQDAIQNCMEGVAAFDDFAGEDFECVLAEWADFVAECEAGFEGSLFDYRNSLLVRDLIQMVIERVGDPLTTKVSEIIHDVDHRFASALTDRERILPLPDGSRHQGTTPFWYRGIPSGYGLEMRRELIRCGWFLNA